jgi:hypothetical protein
MFASWLDFVYAGIKALEFYKFRLLIDKYIVLKLKNGGKLI